MVKNHVQNDLNPILLQFINQLLQFIALVIMLHHGRVPCIGSKKAYRIISPVIVELYSVHNPGILHLIEFEDGHQFHRINAEILQIRNLLTQAFIGSLCSHP